MTRKSLQSKPKKVSLSFYPKILIFFGIFLMSVFVGWRYYQLRILSFDTSDGIGVTKSNNIKPVYIKSYPVGIDIEIKESAIVNGVWFIHPDSANYLVSSAGVGDIGNLIVYGHNKDDILGPLRWIKIGALIEIAASDGNHYNYRVVKTDIVSPDNLEYIQNTTNETMTLYTCTGFLDSKRFIVVAKRI